MADLATVVHRIRIPGRSMALRTIAADFGVRTDTTKNIPGPCTQSAGSEQLITIEKCVTNNKKQRKKSGKIGSGR